MHFYTGLPKKFNIRELSRRPKRNASTTDSKTNGPAKIPLSTASIRNWRPRNSKDLVKYKL